MTATIRRARDADIPAVAVVVRDAYAPHAGLHELPDVAGSVADDMQVGEAWVAEVSFCIAGVVITARDGTALRIVNLAVDPIVRGQGIGTALMTHVADVAKRTGATVMRLTTHRDMPRTIAFYEHLGWAVTEREGAQVMMERRLPSGRGSD